jgi:hypothetical protein
VGELCLFRFHGDDLEVIRGEGTADIIIRRFCEALGVSFQGQIEKLKADPSISIKMILMQVPGDIQRREVACLDIRSIPLWLATIHPSKVAPELRAKLIAYKREAAEVLADHFLGPRGRPAKLRSVAFEEIFGDVFDKAREPQRVRVPERPLSPRTIPELQHVALDVLRGALDRGDSDEAKLLLRTIGTLVGHHPGRPGKPAAEPAPAQQKLDFEPPARVVAPQPVAPVSAMPDPGVMLVAGLAEALADLGLEEVGATRLHTILTSDPERFRLLRRAVEIAFPRRVRGKFPSVKQLGRVLGAIDRIPYDGRRIARRVLDGYTLWRVESADGTALQ